MGVKIAVGSVVYVLVAVGVSWWFWACLSTGEPSVSVVIRNLVLIWGAPVAGGLAVWRCRTADRNLRHQQYLTGSELLSSRQEDNSDQRYMNRVVGTVTLAKLMEEDPKQYDEKVVKVFERVLSNPPGFGGDNDGHREGETDYESGDTVEAIRALRKRSRKQKQAHPPRLWPKNGPLRVEEGDVVPNPSHEHYKRWMKVKGRPPIY